VTLSAAAIRGGTGGPPELRGTPRILIRTRIKISKSEAIFSICATKRRHANVFFLLTPRRFSRDLAPAGI
jgi:hypothetical protein